VYKNASVSDEEEFEILLTSEVDMPGVGFNKLDNNQLRVTPMKRNKRSLASQFMDFHLLMEGNKKQVICFIPMLILVC
jgi:hypothetical protein